MSGDVQPRKRKDKRKRRDDRKSEGDVTILRQSSFQDDDDSSSHGVHITKMGNDDVHLHVQHQHGTGGHWCAKIIFFSLMAVLLGLVGLIIMENRGIEDLDTPLSESRYSNYFDGWVEEHRAEEHDEHGEHLSHEAALDEHDDEHDDEVEEPYEQHSGEEEEAEQEHEEDANDEDDEEEEENTAAENVTAEDDEEKDEDDDIAESADRTQSLADDAEEEEEEADEEEEEEEDADDDIEESIEPIASKSRAQSAPETVEDDEEDDNIEEEQEEEDEDEEEEQAESVEPTISKSQAADDDDEQDNDEDAAEEEDEELEESAEPAAQSVPDDDDDEFEQADNDEDEFESLDQDVDTQAEQLKAKEAKDQAAEENIEAVTTTSWLGSQIKPKEPTGAKFVEDELFEQELRRAQAEMINENHANALRAFNTLTHTYAHKPLAHLRRAQALERIAELRRSNQLLMDAIESYKRYLAFDESITNIDYRTAGERCIEHMRFLGQTQPAVAIHELLIERYPDEVQLRNQLSLTYLMSNNLIKLQQVSRDTLKRWPRDPLAQLHFGLTLKQVDGDYAQALPYLQRAIDSQAAGTQEPYFYLALGETLQRLGKQAEALQLYERGVMRGYFASVYQRSLYNVPRLRAKPFWQITDTDQAKELKQLQQSWRSIRNEALALLNVEGNFQLEAEQLRDSGNWQQFELFARGQRLHRNCQRAPITCALLEKLPAASGCRRGQIKFSAMQAQTHVWPHCGPTNCRLRAHLTLVAPEPHLTSLRVADQERTWHEGDLFIFDDSFEHEVWHNGTQLRLVLILDLWHPDLTAQQRRELTPI
ncbi:PREDICTED: aspartyl/asparaginyl beta-hydroxylase isoform X5 [Drosophila arizonae]|uniref:Aspartyl/asparaginyl beta-hydroxylase isoform X5 n=1 Tax=Drosophila arizonae TaxID=7263 RepID=A0ABM1PDR7_DROAR|nr:PREDICTED: aspartyl/asparaginyl beta-hydroxylase isoform X5 [Drosophila arizonae]